MTKRRSILTALVAYLEGLEAFRDAFPGGVWPSPAPQETALPYVTVRLEGEEVRDFTEGAGGTEPWFHDVTVRLSVFAPGFAADDGREALRPMLAWVGVPLPRGYRLAGVEDLPGGFGPAGDRVSGGQTVCEGYLRFQILTQRDRGPMTVESVTFTVTLSWSVTDQFNGVWQSSNANEIRASQNYAAGTGNGQVDQVLPKRYAIAAGGTQDIDLAGALADFFGATVSAVKCRGFVLRLLDETGSTASEVKITPAPSNGFAAWTASGAATDGVKVKLGGFAALGCGANNSYPSTAGSLDTLRVTNLDGSNPAIIEFGFLGLST